MGEKIINPKEDQNPTPNGEEPEGFLSSLYEEGGYDEGEIDEKEGPKEGPTR
jgi:hypothetical protein